MPRIAVSTIGQGQAFNSAVEALTGVLRGSNGEVSNNAETCTQLTVNGAVALKWNAQTISYAMLSPGATGGGDCIVEIDCTAGAKNVTLPSPVTVGAGNYVKVIKKDGANNATILPNGSETINGSASKVLSTQYSVCTLYSNGTNWYASTTTS